MIIQRLNEFNNNVDYVNNLTDLECDYLSHISGDYANIDKDIFILVGYNPHSNYKRIKISTKDDRYKTFSIDIDRLVVIGDYDQSIITKEVINNLFRWIKINRDLLEELSNSEDYCVSKILELRKIS